jgi:putative chitinase
MRLEQAQAIFPRADRAWLIPMIQEMPKWGIDTPIEEASFCSQLGPESRGMTKFDENLDYRAERLAEVWPSRFFLKTIDKQMDGKKRDAYLYSHDPRKLAEAVYGGRNGNGAEGSGDGWLYRGGGPPQLTGRANYAKAAAGIGYDLVNKPNDVRTIPLIGVRAACWFWKANGFDAIDDDDEIRSESRRLNGGETGLQERGRYFAAAKQVLGLTAAAVAA